MNINFQLNIEDTSDATWQWSWYQQKIHLQNGQVWQKTIRRNKPDSHHSSPEREIMVQYNPYKFLSQWHCSQTPSQHLKSSHLSCAFGHLFITLLTFEAIGLPLKSDKVTGCERLCTEEFGSESISQGLLLSRKLYGLYCTEISV